MDDLYFTWQDLADEEEQPDSDLSGPAPLQGMDWKQVKSTIELPPELESLLEKKEQLERRLRMLAGEIEPEPVDERDQKRFPVREHTKESRLEDRRLQQRDEANRLRKLHALQAKVAVEKRILQALERRAERERERQLARRQQAVILHRRARLVEEMRQRERLEIHRQRALNLRQRSKQDEEQWMADRITRAGWFDRIHTQTQELKNHDLLRQRLLVRRLEERKSTLHREKDEQQERLQDRDQRRLKHREHRNL